MAKDFEMGYLLDFYGEVLTPKQREMLRQYYNDDLSLSEIGENFGITRQGARDAIKHGETALKELEDKVGFAARYRRVQQTLEELEQLVIDARFECTGPERPADHHRVCRHSEQDAGAHPLHRRSE